MWNHDLSQAPRGKMVHSTRTVGDRVHEISDFVADHIWAASKCGKVIKSYWIPPVGKAAGRWSGFATGEAPIAWQRFVVPEHPFQESPRKAAEAVAERPASTGATVASGLVEADKAEAVAGGLGQPELIPALTAQHGGVNVGGPEKAGVTGGESAATQFYLEDVGGGA
ncbi:hypothetical protein [Agrobacterium tumefaciens]|uniref:hypothetical protein n=1 Tax=Agrobacterium tumefaciens TaxID=358 RepID=UPI0015747192|nr:hypothetical protein [Agrobacterium tumefaciens]NTB01608.1 hypothetical protein [Agrobacterium tumefaciens]